MIKPLIIVVMLVIVVMLYLSSAVTAKDRPINEMPMYGGEHDPEVEQNKKFSAMMARLAWQYYSQQDFDTAIKRFNQAWMFDRNSIDALWGFGLIMGQRSLEELPEQNLKESIRYLSMAVEKLPTDVRLLVDLAFSHTMLGRYLKDSGRTGSEPEFLKAEHLYEAAERLDSEFPPLHYNWSALEFYRGHYLKAQMRLARAKNLGLDPDPKYVRELESKLNK